MSEDYVPSEAEEGYDYTAADRAAVATSTNPLGSTSNSVDDDDGLVAVSSRTDATPEEIEKEQRRFIGPGNHTVYIKDIIWENDKKPVSMKMYVKTESGSVRPMSLDSQKVRVVFAIPGDENCTIFDTFVLPPGLESQMEAYDYGWSDTQGKGERSALDNHRNKGGAHSKKLLQFLGHLGFVFDSKGRIPLAATKFANWKKYPDTNIHKQVKIEVTKSQEGQKYTDKKTGEEKISKGFSNINMYSYRSVPIPSEVEVARKAAEVARNRELAASVVKNQQQAQEPAQEEHDEAPEEKPVKKTKKVTAQA